ncbi:MAG: tetratricopeptide repeat protein [Phaeodactylibacter sp.]|nr:tetratricopeptide repeat protein [Phaeodactylibacter sp.]MCB9264433.1 tetratricopeptide repeat protein [Lewinellaceae bacterium]MCB9286224.1 tetratricopeptide repeat protein [Lewinellaceae bacterium]
MMRSLILIAAIFTAFTAWGQEAQLAQQYYRDGEFEKAAILYEKLYKQSNYNDFYFDRYVESLMAMESFEECEQVIKKQLRRDPDNVQLYVTYGKLFERQVLDDKAEEQYHLAIEKLPKDQFSITRLANSFMVITKYDLAIETYERGAELLKDKEAFAYNLGELYRRKGDSEKMIESYLSSIDANPGRTNSVKAIFQRYLLPDDYQELQAQLYARIQNDPDAVFYPEMLSWVFIQQKDYRNAFRQARALDRRLRENGGRVFRIGEIAANDKAYEAAIMAYDYIVSEKGPASTFYIDAKRESLRCKRWQLVEGYDYSPEELKQLEQEYESFLDEFGRSKLTANIILELAELEALYINDLDKAISLLREMIEYPNVNPAIQAMGKIKLADYYLMQGERWEATLLYSQVDKAFKEDQLGHEARFRNAKLSYYTGDFQWAQAQFDILKASTSKLIANDALDLSVFIMDNLGLDTTAEALQLYADADLLVFQNRFEDAFNKLDTLRSKFPDHSLNDDLYYLEAQIYKKKRDYEKAAELLQKIVDEHPDEIRADNALFELAGLYENQLNDLEKAKALYETLFIDHSGSTFAVEARKRYRVLRGDTVQ